MWGSHTMGGWATGFAERVAEPVSIGAASRWVVAVKPAETSAFASTVRTRVSTSAVAIAVTVVVVLSVVLAVGLVWPPSDDVEDVAFEDVGTLTCCASISAVE